MKIVIIGGCGHVGLPLAVSLADSGSSVISFDTDPVAVDLVNSGRAQFEETLLNSAIQRNLGKTFLASTDASSISSAETLVMIVGTPLDIHMNPDPNAVVKAIADIKHLLQEGQLLILRSTVFPGVTKRIEQLLHHEHLKIDVAFCPERIVEGAAMEELKSLPQIIGVRNDLTFDRAKQVFDLLGIKSIRTTPEEAELAKLFTNAWRYIKFATANQFWMLAADAGVDFENVRDAIRFDYPRAADLPGAGFAAGPCLLKDTMQLASHSGNNFALGQAAMLVNEGQPNFIVDKLKQKYDLTELSVGILGMAFKGESDDSRSSLAYKLKRILKFNCREVLTTDPFVKGDEDLQDFEYVITTSDLLIIGAPHKMYAEFKTDKPVIDIWNLRKNGSKV